MIKPDLFFVFDVESIGLHGEAFAAAFVLIDVQGNALDSGCWATDPVYAYGTEDGHKWVRENIPGMVCNCPSPWLVRTSFWARWVGIKEKYGDRVAMVADCPWPVEARFLAQCVDEKPEWRKWQGPYPLIDLASMRLARGLDPVADVKRQDNEIPKHNPLCDALQSARLLVECLGPA